MKLAIAATTIATLFAGSALAQTAPATAPATTAPAVTAAAPATTAAAGSDAVIVVLPAAVAGGAPAHVLANDLDDEDIYGLNDEEVGEVEDVILNMDGTVAAVVVEVGGFLGIGEKDVLVSWDAIEMVQDGNDLRLVAPGLTREALEAAEGVDIDTMVLGRD